MGKFIKVAAAFDWTKLAFPMFKNFPMIQQTMKTMFPGAVNWLDPLEVTNKFLQAMQDPEFQDIAFTLAQQFMSHRGKPLSIVDKVENYGSTYFDKKGTPLPGRTEADMPSIIEGAYQATTAQLPKKEILPTKTFTDIINEINQIKSRADFQTLDRAGKRKILSNIVEKYQRQLAPFREYLKKNLPLGTN